ncbi:MAG: HAD-IIA family hydrolase [Trueperaceae bacterium]
MSDGSLARKRSLLFDLDGCIWFGDDLADGAAELVRDLRASGRTVGFVTNISSGRSHQIAEKLTRLGIPATSDQVLMPVEALAEHPRMLARPATFVIGQADLRAAVAELTEVTNDPDRAELVLLSRDPQLHYDDLADALQPLLRGAPLLALNVDLRVPVANGRILPGAGALATALATAAGIEVEVVGKPSRFFLDAALRRFGVDRDQAVMVGDTLDSDIAGGIAAGLTTVHVGGDLRSLRDPAPRPDLSLPDVRALRACLAM